MAVQVGSSSLDLKRSDDHKEEVQLGSMLKEEAWEDEEAWLEADFPMRMPGRQQYFKLRGRTEPILSWIGLRYMLPSAKMLRDSS